MIAEALLCNEPRLRAAEAEPYCADCEGDCVDSSDRFLLGLTPGNPELDNEASVFVKVNVKYLSSSNPHTVIINFAYVRLRGAALHPPLFDAVKAEFHTSPSVVIYNAEALTNPLDKDFIFSISAESVTLDLNVNTISPYVTAQQAVSGWETLPEETKKTLIYTGNIMNV